MIAPLAVAAAVVVLGMLGTSIDGAGAVVSRSHRIEKVGSVPLVGTTSLAFPEQGGVMLAHARADAGVLVSFDISDPERPVELDRIGVPSQVYMEDMTLAERDDASFVLVREDGNLTIVDVTNPADLKRRGTVALASHTWNCVGPACEFAYSNGLAPPDNSFSVVDLRDLDAPAVAVTHSSKAGIIHDWDQDAAGLMWAVGTDGIAVYDASDPLDPVLLNLSNASGSRTSLAEYNDHLQLHGAHRPNARRYDDGTRGFDPSIARGDVLLVTEEGDNADCTDSFQTWRVTDIDESMAGDPAPSTGTIAPIAAWSLTDAPIGTWSPTAQFCSVHWFDVHPRGFVVVPTYGNGTRVLDVRDASDIRQVAHHFEDGDQAVQSYWGRQSAGRAEGATYELVYTADAGNALNALAPAGIVGGGIDIFRARLPD